MDTLSPGSVFYVAPNNNKVGPMTEEIIREKVRSGEYTGSVLAWKEGTADWTPLSQMFPHLFLGTPLPSTPPVAGAKSLIGDRFLGLLVDGVILTVGCGILATIFFWLGPLDTLIFFVPPLYMGLTLGSKKQASPGMSLCKLKIVTVSGGTVDFKRGFLRALLAIIFGAFFALGYLWALWDPNGQTLHDKFAGTLVIKA